MKKVEEGRKKEWRGTRNRNRKEAAGENGTLAGEEDSLDGWMEYNTGGERQREKKNHEKEPKDGA